MAASICRRAASIFLMSIRRIVAPGAVIHQDERGRIDSGHGRRHLEREPAAVAFDNHGLAALLAPARDLFLAHPAQSEASRLQLRLQAGARRKL